MADILDQYGNAIGWSIDRGNGRVDLYDLRGNMTGYSIARGDSGYADQFDANGNIIGTSFTDQNGSITYYDNQGRPLQRQDTAPEQPPPPQEAPAEKLSTRDALRSLLIPDPVFRSPQRKDEDTSGNVVARFVMAAILAVVTFLLTKAQLPYAVMAGVLTLLAFYISRSFLKQRLLTGMIVVNTVYTMLMSMVYAQFLWTFPFKNAEPLQFIVVGTFFLIGLIFVGSIEGKGYFSYSMTKVFEVLFFLALSITWLFCFLNGNSAESMRNVMNGIVAVQGVYSLIVIMHRLVDLLNIVRSKSGICESTTGQMLRYVLYVVLFFAIRKLDPEATPILMILLCSSAVAFLLTRLNVLNRFRTLTVLINALYSLVLLACFTNYMIHLHEWRPAGVVLLFCLMLFTGIFLTANLEQGSYASFRFTKLISILLLLAQAVLYVTYSLRIAQDFIWADIRGLMKYILHGGAVFAVVVLIVQLVTGIRRRKQAPAT